MENLVESTDRYLLLDVSPSKNHENEGSEALKITFKDVEEFIFKKNNENANTPHNPESINLSIAEFVIKQYMLRKVYSEDVARAHERGQIHIHDLGMVRPYCGGHSLEYIKKYGLHLPDITSRSLPAKHPEVLVGHLVKMSSTLQSYYAGAVGWDAVNVFFSTHLLGKSYNEIKQIAQMLIFEFNQLAGARGAQVVFSDFNLFYAVPYFYRETPAVGPSGKYMLISDESLLKKYSLDDLYKNNQIKFVDSVDIDENGYDRRSKMYVLKYKDFEKKAQEFLRAMFEVYLEGDAQGKTFFFPKPLLHINEDFWNAEGHEEFLEFVALVSAEQGTPYYVFERNGASTISQCCRLRMNLGSIDLERARTKPESLRFSSLQNVTINLPQAAYLSSNLNEFFDNLDKAMDLAMKAHLQKLEFIRKMLNTENPPLKLFKLELDGEPYLRDDSLSMLIGMVGLNEAVKSLTGKELHEDEEVFKLGLRIIAHMAAKASVYSSKYGYKIVLEESPAESATYRLAKIDKAMFPDKFAGKENSIGVYYTNSVHFAYDAPIDWVERVYMQSKFHPLIDGGAIIHIWLGESKPSAKAIAKFVKNTYFNTTAQQIAFSPEFTVCEKCSTTHRGLLESCPSCGNRDVYGVTRVVGYFSKISHWNPGKRAELLDRVRMPI